MIQLVPNKDQLRQSMMSKESMASNKSGRSDGTKIYDEEHDFGLCDFYGKMFRMCKELGFDNENCQQQLAHKTGGGTFFHYAAKKNNKPLFDYLVLNLDETIIKQQVHVIDDFGKKAIDLANPKKKNSLFEEFSALMVSFPAEDIDFSNPANEQVFAKEWKYQLQKNPELRKKLEAAKKAQAQSKLDDGANSNDLLDEKSGMPSNVAGQEKVIKASDIMSPYEAEELVPAEYKKCFKMLNNQGWKALDNKWPNNGQTVLHYAAKTGKEDLCHFLILHYGADPEQKCHHGHDAAWYAKSKKHRLLAKKLYFRFLKEVK
ncbi:unnamed protein product [Amoebophrya sp. A120]|nr:unnamed protein product [Amoebophrya sp. A120]|eukprot:GSA120T00025464001.1